MDRTVASLASRRLNHRPSLDTRGDGGVDLRCGCHRLLARAVEDGIELRCVRCKTDTLLRWDMIRGLEQQAACVRTIAAPGGAAVLTAPCAKVDDRG